MKRKYYIDDKKEGRVRLEFKELPTIQPPFDLYRLPEVLVAGNRATRRRFPHPLEVIASDPAANDGSAQGIIFEDIDGVHPLTVKPDETVSVSSSNPWKRIGGLVKSSLRRLPMPSFTRLKRELTEDETELLNSVKALLDDRQLMQRLEHDCEERLIDYKEYREKIRRIASGRYRSGVIKGFKSLAADEKEVTISLLDEYSYDPPYQTKQTIKMLRDLRAACNTTKR